MALGKFINAVLNFLVAAAIYVLVGVPMPQVQERLRKEEAASPPPEPPGEVRLLREILQELRKRA
ncbi:MAG: hypothetical protein RMI39_03160 [Thermoanaerobaculum sp.]|nr:hypothetical protein [Thermoanaerobaculum sp.]